MSSFFSALSGSSKTPKSDNTDRAPPTQEQRTAEARNAFDASLRASATTIDNELQSRAKTIHENAARLDQQDTRVQSGIKGLTAEGEGAEELLAKTSRSLQQIAGTEGEDRNAADRFDEELARIEKDLDFLDDMLDEVESKDGSTKSRLGNTDSAGHSN